MKAKALIADMAGTTIEDNGLVVQAFAMALDQLGIENNHPKRQASIDFIIGTMGQSKIEVFTELFGAEEAHVANDAFETSYLECIERQGVEAIPGVEELFDALEEKGIALALTTGFSPQTRNALLEALGWSNRITFALSPSDAGRGRPHPDMILKASELLGISEMSSVAVAGDTASDMQAGVNAKAGWIVGVLTGTDDEPRLREAGASHIVDSIASIESVFAI